MILRHELEEKVKYNYGYRNQNWGDLSIFQGDYINFGYWKKISFKASLTIKDRISSSEELYGYVLPALHATNNNDVIVELGCGRGVGILNALPYIEFGAFIGIDLSPAQIDRAKLNKKKCEKAHCKRLMQLEAIKYQLNLLEREWRLEQEDNKDTREGFKHKLENLSHSITEDLKVYDINEKIAKLHDAIDEEETKEDNFKEIESDFRLQMELVQHQIEIKDKLSQKLNSIEFRVASAYSMGLPDHSVNKIFSIEVLQHINDFPALSTEIKRILIPGGAFVFCADFATNEANKNKLVEEDLLIDEVEILAPVTLVENSFKQNGFDVHYHSIGGFVFEGYEAWVQQLNITGDVSHKIWDSYQAGYIDYYIFTISLPGKVGEGNNNGYDEM